MNKIILSLGLLICLGSFTSNCMDSKNQWKEYSDDSDCYTLIPAITKLIQRVDPNNEDLFSWSPELPENYYVWPEDYVKSIQKLRISTGRDIQPETDKEKKARDCLNKMIEEKGKNWLPKISMMHMLYTIKITEHQKNIINISTQSGQPGLNINRILLEKNVQGSMALKRIEQLLSGI